MEGNPGSSSRGDDRVRRFRAPRHLRNKHWFCQWASSWGLTCNGRHEWWGGLVLNSLSPRSRQPDTLTASDLSLNAGDSLRERMGKSQPLTSKLEALSQCCFDIGPASLTLPNIKTALWQPLVFAGWTCGLHQINMNKGRFDKTLPLNPYIAEIISYKPWKAKGFLNLKLT